MSIPASSRTEPLIEFDCLICGDFEQATSREWLEANGIGGFASSTITDLNTRRYHGLLTAATKPPVGRVLLLSKLEETLIVNGERHELSSNQYAGAVYPNGQRYLHSFRLDPFPIFTYRVGEIEIEKTVSLIHGENTVVVRYEMFGDAQQSCVLEIRPLIAFRDYHSTTHENGAINGHVEVAPRCATVSPYQGLPDLHFCHNASSIDTSGFWFRNFQYAREIERGLDAVEDLYSPFLLGFNLRPSEPAAVIASLSIHDPSEAGAMLQSEIDRRAGVSSASPSPDDFARLLTDAADQFLVSRGPDKTVIAGYPWFGDWGRDTMIALPGLTLVTKRFEEARNILRAFAKSIDQGMLPNRFPEAGESPEYNTVDATLWMFHAVHEFLRYTRDYDFVRAEIYEGLADILAWHERGTRYNIHLDSDGLLFAGDAGTQLTWMDAKIGDWVVTPRHGKAVEIQALWYNALRYMERLAANFGDLSRGAHYAELAERTRSRFVEAFWNEADGCLFDVIRDGFADRAIRPNQVLAISLPHELLPRDKAMRVLEVVEWELLTPYGLRTLSARDPAYRGRYNGDSRSRDSAYHQGTVWPWLLGPFLTAYVHLHGDSQEARKRADQFLEPLRAHLWQAGLGQISEVFDGDLPHRPGGCIAQAWSVGEILRTYTEDACGLKPPDF